MSCCLVVYDIGNAKRLRKVATLMQGFGYRVQKSVFECDLKDADRKRMLEKAETLLEPEEDRIRLYNLPQGAIQNAVVLGVALGGLPFEKAVVA